MRAVDAVLTADERANRHGFTPFRGNRTKRPPLVELAMAVHLIVLIIGGPILLLMAAWLISGLLH